MQYQEEYREPQELFPGLYQIQVPLPDNPLRQLNAYFIQGRERSLLIDTGFRKEPSWISLQKSLHLLHVDMEKTDVFLTHLHDDHLGLAALLANDHNRIYLHPTESAQVYRFNDRKEWEPVIAFHVSMGLKAQTAWDGLAGFHHSSGFRGNMPQEQYTDILDGDVLAVGEYRFRCLLTPGHTLAHCCLYEERLGILIGGDLILARITPNVTYGHFDWLENPLKTYLESLDRIEALPVRVTLPGHRAVITDTNQRIQELRDHYRRRLEEIYEILKQGGPMTPERVASQVRWSISIRRWEDFPPTQKFFAVGECMAHLVYLEKAHRVIQSLQNEKIIFEAVYGVENK